MNKKTLLTPEQIIADADKFKNQCRQTFNTNSGKSVLKQLKRIYCDGNLYGQDDRMTAYMIGQRDLILELVANADLNTEIDIEG